MLILVRPLTLEKIREGELSRFLWPEFEGGVLFVMRVHVLYEVVTSYINFVKLTMHVELEHCSGIAEVMSSTPALVSLNFVRL